MIDIKRLPKSRAARLQMMLLACEDVQFHATKLADATKRGLQLDPNFVAQLNRSVEMINFLRTYEAIETID